MEDHRLKSYCLVVETKSFSRAAQTKHMTQSAMSRLVKGLEDELGVRLLQRAGKSVTLTPEGRIFYDHAKRLLDGYVRMEKDINDSLGAARGSLSLGSSPTPAFHLLSRALSDFTKLHPKLRIDLIVERSEFVLSKLRQGRIDIGIVESRCLDEAFSALELAADEVVLIAPAHHPLTKKKSVTMLDLLITPFILPGYGSGTRALVDDYFAAEGEDMRRLNVRLNVGSPEFVVRMVELGLGIAFASRWSVSASVKDGLVKVLRQPGRRIQRKFYLVNMDHEPASAAGRSFKEFLKRRQFTVPH